MEKRNEFWKIKDKRRLLLILIQELAGDAHISFEGDLRGLRLLNLPGASEEPTLTLKRNTTWPKQDFVVLPLEHGGGESIISAIGGTPPNAILHIQIEKGGVLQFGAYDNFHPQCIFFGGAAKDKIVELLISEDIIRPHLEHPPKPEHRV